MQHFGDTYFPDARAYRGPQVRPRPHAAKTIHARNAKLSGVRSRKG